MQNFINNYKKELLFLNKPITFTETGTGKEIILKIPTLYQLYNEDGLMSLMGLLEQDIKEIGKMIPGVNIKTHYDFLSVIFALSTKKEELREFSDSIISGLRIILPKFEITAGLIKFENDIFMTSKLFNSIQAILSESMGREKPIIINEDDDEFTRREKEAEMRVRKIKESARKNKNKSKNDFEDMIVTLLYEYPQYKLEDFFNMNMYTIQFLYKYVGKIANYEVMKIAAGNGLAKDFKYFTD